MTRSSPREPSMRPARWPACWFVAQRRRETPRIRPSDTAVEKAPGPAHHSWQPIDGRQALQNAGVTLAFPRDSAGGSLSVILGGVGISLYDLTALYSGLANGGQMVMPVYLADAKPQATGRLMNDTSAWYVTDNWWICIG